MSINLSEIAPNLFPPLMTGEWNVVVAGFTPVKGADVPKGEARLISQVFYNHFAEEIEGLAEESGLSVQVLEPDLSPTIRGATPEEREKHAENLLKRTNANMIIYGTVQQAGGSLQLQPEFYVMLEDTHETQELVGKYAFGSVIEIIGSGENLPAQISLNLELSQRAQALGLITRGLTFYTINRYDEALKWFEKANDEKYWEVTDEGREVVYQFQGNSYQIMFLLPEAEQAYLTALKIEPQYARSYAGLGNIAFLRSIERQPGEPFSPDMELLDEALQYFERASKAEVQPASADIPAKVAFGRGQIYTAQWFAGQETLAQAIEQFEFVIGKYSEGNNVRLREFAAESHARLGLIEHEQESGSTQLAIQRYLTAIELSMTENRRGLFLSVLAELYGELGQEAEARDANMRAISEYEMALKLTDRKERKADYLAEIATLYERLGEIDEAIRILEQAVSSLPEESETRALFQKRIEALR
jgi:tetratricopeptide (TPR) repeat protein